MTDREKLIGLLWRMYDKTFHMCVIEGVADHLLANGVVVRSWIPVAERLPKPHELVLCIWKRSVGCDAGYYGFARYQYDDTWYVSNEGMPEVTHWMPLPKPPKEVE